MSTLSQQKDIIERTCKSYLGLPLIPISKLQAESSRDVPSRGPVWISRSHFPAPPEDGLKEALFTIIDSLKEPEHIIQSPAELDQVNVGVEFISNRKGAREGDTEPDISEPEKLKRIENDLETDTVILYIHGGGLYFSSPAAYRASSVRLARLTGALVASTSYRLCPQHTFPAPLLDVLIAYTTLIHTYIPRLPGIKRVVLAGNSAGATLAFGLVKFLLEFNKRPDPTVMFHGQIINLPLPEGIAVVSSWCDPTDSLPSWLNPNATDILTSLQPALWPEFPPDKIWPSNPPREHPYARAATLDHELVNPAAVRDWTGAPPMWITVGGLERGRDGNAVVASQAAKCGVSVTWTEWEGMCHEWMIVTRGLPQASLTFKLWAEACMKLSSDQTKAKSPAILYRMPDCVPVEILGGVEELNQVAFDAVRRLMKIRNKQRPIWVGKPRNGGKTGQAQL
ncbi:alpha/beta-hydrolase [Lophiostoma macrostomum CBS 122681]|uniref:Alpha/beta-hydrolase n=1 Tax=Lophiostoma macrostomum CBS 122681 TaxID=1314788 RepID=A0A6A6T9Y8_9PLEO|nr:alpha/beta-hydrolase [Lophiostoma macrostomum CBS 122681]